MSKAWNRVRYSVWAGIYDPMARTLARARASAVAGIAIGEGERVLLVGAGTGLDLPLLPETTRAVATDLTPAMLARARRRAPRHAFAIADAATLPFADGAFDVVLLHFVVTVTGDAPGCLRDAARVTRPGGRLSVLDKFVPDGESPSTGRRLLNVLSRATFSDITVDLGAALTAAAAAPLEIVSRRPAALGGRYEAIVLRRR